jgi:hypothetical protein
MAPRKSNWIVSAMTVLPLLTLLGSGSHPITPGAIPVFPMGSPLRFPVFVEFTHDKIFFRSTPIKSAQGQCEFSDGSLLVKLPNEPPFKSKPRVNSEQTGIRISTKGPEIPFRRVTGSECAAQLEPTKQP